MPQLVTSNARKLREFERFGLSLSLAFGVDLPEVDGDADEVVVRKALAAGADRIVEDTILEINGEPIVDIRWRLDEAAQLDGAPARWVVSLGLNDGRSIRVYRGAVHGTISGGGPAPADAFGFDPFFVPSGCDLSLYMLDRLGRKDEYSARRLACEAMMADRAVLVRPLHQITAWTGGWQS